MVEKFLPMIDAKYTIAVGKLLGQPHIIFLKVSFDFLKNIRMIPVGQANFRPHTVGAKVSYAFLFLFHRPPWSNIAITQLFSYLTSLEGKREPLRKTRKAVKEAHSVWGSTEPHHVNVLGKRSHLCSGHQVLELLQDSESYRRKKFHW
jgi:hypothetical protein